MSSTTSPNRFNVNARGVILSGAKDPRSLAIQPVVRGSFASLRMTLAPAEVLS